MQPGLIGKRKAVFALPVVKKENLKNSFFDLLIVSMLALVPMLSVG